MKRVLGVLMAVAMVLGGAVAVDAGTAPGAHAIGEEGSAAHAGVGLGATEESGGEASGMPQESGAEGSDAEGSGADGAGADGSGDVGDPGGSEGDSAADGSGGPDDPERPEITTGSVAIEGAAVVGRTLIAKTEAWSPEGVELSYAWMRDGQPIPNATTSAYTLTAADRGKRISVLVTAHLEGAWPRQERSEQTAPVAPGTLAQATPKISGNAVVGKTLTAKAGAWTSGAQLSYQWKRNGKSIKGATKASYRVQSADAKARITVTVTGKLAGYTTAAKTSKPTAAVLRVLTAAPTPKIGGTVRAGQVLTAKTGSWKPAPVKLSYRWLRDGKAITGATKSSYRLTKSDAGRKISVQVRGAKSGYVSATKISAAKRVPKVLKAATPKVSGSATVGNTLKVSRGAWTSGTTFSYQWKRNGKSIKGATKTSYRVKAADRGARITVTVKGTKSGYASETRTSAKTRAVSYPNRTSPTSGWNCPAWAPIKGNASSMIYHVPGGAYYGRTNPEECFRTEAAARQAGYRRSLR